jgi:2,3-bisphosphoglycerate-dependent phosphoglycerate mutase
MNLVMVRHGQSMWNLANRFTGWVDVDLSGQGMKEALDAGRILKEKKMTFDRAYTSVLKRAIRTLWIMLDEMDTLWLPTQASWRLNERHYGSLQGLDKVAMVKQHGEKQVQLWRRSYDIPPPPLEVSEGQRMLAQPQYRELSEPVLTESLKDTLERVMPFWREEIFPRIDSGEHVLISAHGNSMRALIKYLDNISDQAITEMNIPTGIPLVYQYLGKRKFVNHGYLGDPEKIKAATAAVAHQTKRRT